MAKAAWCTVTPMTGKENGTINISAVAHTGRTARSTSVLVQAANGTRPSANIAVSQAGAAVSTTMDTNKPDVPKEGATVTINGTSNSSILVWRFGFIVGSSYLPMEQFVQGVKVNGVAITNDTEISGDPGAQARYNFVATIVLGAAPFPKDVLLTFEMTDDTGVKKNCTFTWKAGASSLSVNKSSLSLVDAGTAQPVAVTSNDDWAVS